MSRGISSFRHFSTKVIGGRTHYYCAVCDSRICERRRGNALGAAALAKAAVRKHILERHPDVVLS